MLDRMMDDLFTMLVIFLMIGSFSLAVYFCMFYIPHKIRVIKIKIYNKRKHKRKTRMKQVLNRLDDISIDELCELVDKI